MNIPRTYRDGSNSIGSKIQSLHSKLSRIINSTDDEDELAKLRDAQKELDILQDNYLEEEEKKDARKAEEDEEEKLDGIQPRRLEEDPNITNELETDKLKARYSVLEYHVCRPGRL